MALVWRARLVVPVSPDTLLRLLHAITESPVPTPRRLGVDDVDCSPADVDPPVGGHAGDAFGRGTQLEVVPNSEQDDVAREAMT